MNKSDIGECKKYLVQMGFRKLGIVADNCWFYGEWWVVEFFTDHARIYRFADEKGEIEIIIDDWDDAYHIKDFQKYVKDRVMFFKKMKISSMKNSLEKDFEK